MKTPNPKTNKSKAKPKRKPREWTRYVRVYCDETISDVLWESKSEIAPGARIMKVKVREVIE